jgi:hypothetical protein
MRQYSLGVEGITLDVEAGHLGIADLDRLRIDPRIEFATHLNPVWN